MDNKNIRKTKLKMYDTKAKLLGPRLSYIVGYLQWVNMVGCYLTERESDINKKNLMRLIKELTIICFG